MKKLLGLSIVIFVMVSPLQILASNGLFSHGYGVQNKGRGGVSMAFSDNAYGGANNPATMVFADDRFDIGLEAFCPRRTAERTESSNPAVSPIMKSVSRRNTFIVPELAVNYHIYDCLSVGVTIFGNGLNTTYTNLSGVTGTNLYLSTSKRLSLEATQIVVAPVAAYRMGCF